MKKLSSIEWRKIAGFRNVLTHDYFGIDLEVAWEVVNQKLPELELAINIILKELNTR